MKIKSYKDLKVWQKSVDLVIEIYRLTDKLPTKEKFGLTDQMRRAAVSIPSNIAEGSKRGSRKEYVQFLRISAGSAAELETQLIILEKIYRHKDFVVFELLVEIQKMLSSLIRNLLKPNN